MLIIICRFFKFSIKNISNKNDMFKRDFLRNNLLWLLIDVLKFLIYNLINKSFKKFIIYCHAVKAYTKKTKKIVVKRAVKIINRFIFLLIINSVFYFVRIERKQHKLFDKSFSLFFIASNKNNNKFFNISIINAVFFFKLASSKNQIKKTKFFIITLAQIQSTLKKFKKFFL